MASLPLNTMHHIKNKRVCSSINLGSTKTGINMDAVKLMGEIVKETAEYTKDNGSMGCAPWLFLLSWYKYCSEGFPDRNRYNPKG